MTLVDTSVWVNHLRAGSPHLATFLQESLVLTHSYVIGELACGMLKNRSEILALLKALPKARIAEDDEVLHLLESKKNIWSRTWMGRYQSPSLRSVDRLRFVDR